MALQQTFQLPLVQRGEQLHKIRAKKSKAKNFITIVLMVKSVICIVSFPLDRVFDLIVIQLLQLANSFQV